MAYPQPTQGYQPGPPSYSPYAGQPQPGYAPQPPPQQYGYQPAAYGGQQQQANTNVVVVQQQAAPRQVTYVERDDGPNHLLHCIITLFCPWWIFIWLIVCCVYGC